VIELPSVHHLFDIIDKMSEWLKYIHFDFLWFL
jgi:hypothetical protein